MDDLCSSAGGIRRDGFHDGIRAPDVRPLCDRRYPIIGDAAVNFSPSHEVERRAESREQRSGDARHVRRLDVEANAHPAVVINAGETGARGRDEGRRALIAPQLGRWSHSTFGMHPRGGGWGRYTAHHLAACWSRRRSR
jgi:hypothetical protein